MVCTCRLEYDNGASISIPWHAIFVFLDPILLGVMQVEYQNKKESPFDTHPLQKHTFLTAICIYGALLGIKIHTKIHGGYLEEILSYSLLLSGVFSSVSLLSIMLQQQFLWIVLIIWGSIPIILAHRTLKSSACWIIQILPKFKWRVKLSSASGSHDIYPRV
ncbi:hypothetical protein VNO78_25493 [Psophocarpus tetragonolobus]|uniref:Uncharacterized protein n=1 Tax=Psophocarpus tetragonolobus TaxID=3891 RepID=A0AAN9XFV2_PSOTE